MKSLVLAFALAATGCAGHSEARKDGPVTAPQKDGTFLQRIAGEWAYDIDTSSGPGQPPQKFSGTEQVRTVGPWAVLESHHQVQGHPFTGILTVGARSGGKGYVGTWICSDSDALVQYEGTLDDTGRVLTLETKGPDAKDPAKETRYRDVIELIDADHKQITSTIEIDGKWVTYLTGHYRRR